MSPYGHIWGQSAAQDYVWAQVCGMAPVLARRRVFVPFRAFIDDSYNEGGTFVLGGCVATVEAWAEFSKEWEAILPTHGIRHKSGRFHFKMNQMNSPERMARVPAFFRIIEDHVSAFVSAKLNISELRRAQSRLCVPNVSVDWGDFNDPCRLAYRGLLDMFHTNRAMLDWVVPADSKIDFYFDEHTNKNPVLRSWDEYVQSRPDDIQPLFGAHPRFESDLDFVALQAADFWAWWVRKWYNDGIDVIARNGEKLDFGFFGRVNDRDIVRMDISFNEDQIVEFGKILLHEGLPNEPVYDVKISSGLSS